MNSFKWNRATSVASVFVLGLLLAGCKGIPLKAEKEARQQVQTASGTYRPNGQKPPLRMLTANSSLADILTYALLKQPKVEAAYFDWLASGVLEPRGPKPEGCSGLPPKGSPCPHSWRPGFAPG